MGTFVDLVREVIRDQNITPAERGIVEEAYQKAPAAERLTAYQLIQKQKCEGDVLGWSPCSLLKLFAEEAALPGIFGFTTARTGKPIDSASPVKIVTIDDLDPPLAKKFRGAVRNPRLHDDIRKAYNDATVVDPELEGNITVEFRIGPDGRIMDLTVKEEGTSIHDEGFLGKYTDILREIRFPATGKIVLFEYMRVFYLAE